MTNENVQIETPGHWYGTRIDGTHWRLTWADGSSLFIYKEPTREMHGYFIARPRDKGHEPGSLYPMPHDYSDQESVLIFQALVDARAKLDEGNTKKIERPD